MNWYTPVIVVWLALTLIKSLHTAIVIGWLLEHGPAIGSRLTRPTGSVADNTSEFWNRFRLEGGETKGRVLVYGVKDVLLDRRISRAELAGQRIRTLYWKSFRVVWRVFVLVPVSALALLIIAYLPGEISDLNTWLIFATSLILLILMFLIGFEMVVLVVTVGPWLPYYHRLTPKKPYPATQRKIREALQLLKVSAGASLVTLIAMTGVVGFANLRTDAFSVRLSDEWLLGSLQALARAINLLGTAGDGLEASTVAGTLLSIVLLPLILTYIAFLVPIASSVANGSR